MASFHHGKGMAPYQFAHFLPIEVTCLSLAALTKKQEVTSSKQEMDGRGCQKGRLHVCQWPEAFCKKKTGISSGTPSTMKERRNLSVSQVNEQTEAFVNSPSNSIYVPLSPVQHVGRASPSRLWMESFTFGRSGSEVHTAAVV
eukprot:233104-Pelagomonas_calceolata.AAC.1